MIDDARRSLARFARQHSWLHDAVHPAYHRVRRMLRGGRLRLLGSVLDPAAGNAAIREAILSGEPHAVAKIGSLEAEALAYHLRGRTPPALLREQLFTNVGVFPPSDEAIDDFCRTYLDALAGIDHLAVWGQPGEAAVLAAVPASRTLMAVDAFEPWYFADPWSAALAGKRVVVLHPFAASIERQYARCEAIWPGQSVLPRFDLRTIAMPLSPALRPSRFTNWREQYAWLIKEVEANAYDVVLAGAGGISLLIAEHARARGRVGFHMGGLTQILFGILGRRWEKSAFVMAHRNEAWVRPTEAESPPTVTRVEQGCYW